jgi:hypothetical protein
MEPEKIHNDNGNENTGTLEYTRNDTVNEYNLILSFFRKNNLTDVEKGWLESFGIKNDIDVLKAIIGIMSKRPNI